TEAPTRIRVRRGPRGLRLMIRQRPLPAARPPGGRWRGALRERELAELAECADVHLPLEIDDLLDRPPVIDPAIAVELGLLGHIEPEPLRGRDELQQEPALLLADAERPALPADIALRQPVPQPALRHADQLDVARLEPDLLAQLPKHRGLRALLGADAALRKLP